MKKQLKTRYKLSSRKTRRLIAARLAEGFTLEDFKKVILKKSKQWKGTNMERFLRPETLFGTKFEGYLNERVSTDTPKGGSSPNAYKEFKFDFLEERTVKTDKLLQNLKTEINVLGAIIIDNGVLL